MNSSRSFFSDISWMFVGNLTHAVCQFLTVAVLAQLGGAAEAGNYAYALSLVVPVFAFCTLELRTVHATDTADEFTLHHYIGMRIVSVIVSLLIVGGSLACLGMQEQLGMTVMLLAIVTAIDNMFETLYGLLQKQERLALLSQSMILRGVASVVALSVTYFYTRSLVAGCGAMCVARALSLLFLLLPWRQAIRKITPGDLRHAFEMKPLLQLARTSTPFAALSGLVAVRNSSIRQLIFYFGDAQALGIFSALSALIMPFELVVRSVYQSLLHRMAVYFNAQNLPSLRLVLRRIYQMTAVMLLAVFVGVVVGGDFALLLLFGLEYGQTVSVLILLTVMTGLRSAARPAGVLARAARRLRPVLILQVCSTLLLIGAGVPLVIQFGVVGAAAAQTITAAVVFAVSLWLTEVELRGFRLEGDLVPMPSPEPSCEINQNAGPQRASA